jgi:hypothetical protein
MSGTIAAPLNIFVALVTDDDSGNWPADQFQLKVKAPPETFVAGFKEMVKEKASHRLEHLDADQLAVFHPDDRTAELGAKKTLQEVFGAVAGPVDIYVRYEKCIEPARKKHRPEGNVADLNTSGSSAASSVSMPKDHRRRYADNVRYSWQRGIEKIKKGEILELRDAKIIHFFGESGAGKSDAARYDTVTALIDSGIPESDITLIHTPLEGPDVQHFNKYEQLLNDDQRNERNEAAEMWLTRLLEPAVLRKVNIVVIDEFQLSVPLCRGLSAILTKVSRQLYSKPGRKYLLLVFAGLARKSIQDNTASMLSPSTDKRGVYEQLVHTWPVKGISNLDIAAQFVHHSRGKGYTGTAESLCCNLVVELLRMADSNMAAITYIASMLTKEKVKDLKKFSADDAGQLHKNTVAALISRSSRKDRKWRTELRGIAQNLFDAAVLGRVPVDVGVDLSRWGLLRFEEDPNDQTTLLVSINGFYWAELCVALDVGTPEPFACTPEQFEKLALLWLRCRVVAFSRFLKLRSISIAKLIPGCCMEGEVTLPAAEAIATTHKFLDQLWRGEPDAVNAGVHQPLRLQPPLFGVNGDLAPFADGLVLLQGLSCFVQVKLCSNQVNGKPFRGVPLKLEDVRHERAKAGFPGDFTPNKKKQKKSDFKEQQTLHSHLKKRCARKGKEAAAVFLVFTHKPVRVEQKQLETDTVVVSADNFEAAAGPFARIAYRLIPTKQPVNKAAAKLTAVKKPAKKTKK